MRRENGQIQAFILITSRNDHKVSEIGIVIKDSRALILGAQ